MEQLAELRERQNDLMDKAVKFQQDMRCFKDNLEKEVSLWQYLSKILLKIGKKDLS